MWLARHGWTVTAVDISPTALGRLKARAEADGVADRVDAIHVDLATAFPDVPDGGWNLVSAQCFQSPIALPRTSILRRAAAGIAGGVLLLVVDHGAGPPQSSHHDVVFPTVEETVADLALPSADWTPVRVERSTLDAEDPDSQLCEFVDNVIATLARDEDSDVIDSVTAGLPTPTCCTSCWKRAALVTYGPELSTTIA